MRSIIGRLLALAALVFGFSPAASQNAIISDEELRALSFEQWIETLEGEKSRPDPQGPLVIDYFARDGTAIGLTRRNAISFGRWCNMRGGTGAYTPEANVPIQEVFLNHAPFSAYGQAALKRDGRLLSIPYNSGVSGRNFSNCSDGGLKDLGTFNHVVANQCANSNPADPLMMTCRALVYDEEAIARFRDVIKPAFEAFDRARREAALAASKRFAEWRGNLRPGDRSSIGLVVAVNGAVAQVQDRNGQLRWFRIDELEP